MDACLNPRATHADDHQGLPSYRENCQPENTGQDQGVIQDNGPQLAEEHEQSFNEDARTIVGEENESNNSKYGVTTDDSQGLTNLNGQEMTEEDKESFDGESGTNTGEGKDVSSVGITERGYPEACYGVPKNEGQHSTQKKVEEGNEWTSVDLNEGYTGR